MPFTSNFFLLTSTFDLPTRPNPLYAALRYFMTWATRITILRLILVPVFVAFVITYGSDPHEEIWRYAALLVFSIAAISDAVDGYLARHWNQSSALGALLDPVADKLLLLAALVSLSFKPSLPSQSGFRSSSSAATPSCSSATPSCAISMCPWTSSRTGPAS